MSVGQDPISSSLEGQNISYLGILSSTSTGHQPKISQVFTVLLKGTHLPVRIPVAREQPLGSHGMVDFCSMGAKSQDESRIDALGGEQFGEMWSREADTGNVVVEVTGRGWSYLGPSFLLFLECTHCPPGICHLLGSAG